MKKLFSVLLLGLSFATLASTADKSYSCSVESTSAPTLHISGNSVTAMGESIGYLSVSGGLNDHEELRIMKGETLVAILYDNRDDTYDLAILSEFLYKVVGTTSMVCISPEDLDRYH